MGKETDIQWCHHTFNPWEGCARVSPGCENCYAEDRNERFHGGRHWGAKAPRLMRAEHYWNEPVRWNREAERMGERRRVLCASLADVGEMREDLIQPRERLKRLIFATPWLDWLLLSKRPENYRTVFEEWNEGWPHNAWAGTTVEDNARRSRIDHLLAVPARVRFLSMEPLLEEVDLTDYLSRWGIHWIIVGGESGNKNDVRDCHLSWIEDIVDDCEVAEIPCFVKQLGDAPVIRQRDDLVTLNLGPKGKDMQAWPERLRKREFPLVFHPPVMP